jgi:RNA binding exosome subunit
MYVFLNSEISISRCSPDEGLDLEFSSVTFAFLVHATEDHERLMKLVKETLGIDGSEITTEKIQGYFGNDILSVKAHVIGPRAQLIIHGILSSLSKSSRSILISELDKSIDEHDSLYLRIDRQMLETGEIFLSDEEPIRVKIKPKKRFGGHQFMKQEYEELIK